MTRLSRIAGALTQSLLMALLVAACATSEIYDYPLQWPRVRDTHLRCEIEGEYVNAGVIEPASMGVSTDGSAARLNALLRPAALGPIGPLTADRVAIAVAVSTLTVNVPGESAPTSLPMRGDLSSCLADGGYEIEYSKPYAGEAGAGILHITQLLALAEDGSLVIRSTLVFDASRSIFVRHKQTTVVWYRFMRTAATAESYFYEEATAITPTQVAGGVGSGIHLSVTPRSYVEVEDMHLNARDCTTDAYHCFESCHFSFAVPVMLMMTTKDWTVGKQRYRLLRYFPVYQWGAREIEDVYAIEGAAAPCQDTARSQARRIFYYSPQLGLLSFVDLHVGGEPPQPSVSEYVLRRDCGLASACSRRRPAQ